ncbi:hypothetical protein M011DRAFT_457243 [Sporormia fimetaria CBS 119925]|uniref:Uncharacterized protein n=1 Tax=Sporormia fimetaria CBS 119925 TaxID=1340428 RepID=A0A6A6VH89_9PLEO|nr:hypothetical protein M011DRAFT_457243 [Sporormia fimetaria CBS 119925]
MKQATIFFVLSGLWAAIAAQEYTEDYGHSTPVDYAPQPTVPPYSPHDSTSIDIPSVTDEPDCPCETEGYPPVLPSEEPPAPSSDYPSPSESWTPPGDSTEIIVYPTPPGPVEPPYSPPPTWESPSSITLSYTTSQWEPEPSISESTFYPPPEQTPEPSHSSYDVPSVSEWYPTSSVSFPSPSEGPSTLSTWVQPPSNTTVDLPPETPAPTEPEAPPEFTGGAAGFQGQTGKERVWWVAFLVPVVWAWV